MSPDVRAPARVVSRAGTTTIVAVSGEIDIANASDLRACLAGCLTDGCVDVTLDMRELTFMDARGLSALVYANQLAASRGGRLTLHRPPHIVQRLLELNGLATLIDVADPESP